MTVEPQPTIHRDAFFSCVASRDPLRESVRVREPDQDGKGILEARVPPIQDVRDPSVVQEDVFWAEVAVVERGWEFEVRSSRRQESQYSASFLRTSSGSRGGTLSQTHG